MKKILFTLATVATIFATSCKKENINPATDVLDGEFIATIENNMTQDAPEVNDNMGTKTALVNGKYITWQNGDTITINGVKYVTTAQSGSQASFNISGQGSVGAAPYHAFYPATIQKGSGNTGTLPAEQRFNTARDANGNPIISNIPIYAYSASHSLTFHNIFAVLKIEMPYNVKSFTISSNGKIMNGDFTINNSGYAGMDAVTDTMPGDSTITVKPLADNEVFSEGTTVYVAIPAQKYTEFTFKFTTNNVTKTVSKSFAEKDFKINKLYTVKFSSQKPFYFEALQAGSTVTVGNMATANKLEYSTTGEGPWTTINGGTNNGAIITISLTNEGDRVYFRAPSTNPNNAFNRVKTTADKYGIFTGSGKLKVSGNIMYLLDGSGNTQTLTKGTNNGAFQYLFYHNTALTDASELILPSLVAPKNCYKDMFWSCTSLESAPSSLPATTIDTCCYYEMFRACSLMTSVPAVLPATKIGQASYRNMFNYCKKIESAPVLNVVEFETGTTYNCAGMFIHCEALTSAPVLKARTLTSYCYNLIFDCCNKLGDITIMATDCTASDCLKSFLGDKNTSTTGKDASSRTVHCTSQATDTVSSQNLVNYPWTFDSTVQ